MNNSHLSSDETIFALATPHGRAGVAVMRISGPHATDTYQTITGKTPPTPRKATLTPLYDPSSNILIDEALALYFPAPHSFTGEDVIELHCHGSRAIIASLTAVLSSLAHLRLAEPGEFTRRAFYNHKMDLTQAEGLADLIEAETSAQQIQALKQMRGAMGVFYGNTRERILHLLAHLEAYIDFPDEEIPEAILAEIENNLDNIISILRSHLDAAPKGEKIREGISIAIIGAPNVGKSSLLNALAGRDAAIVSDIAGTTRDIVEIYMDIGGYAVTIADTAGLRAKSNDVIEKEGIKRALERAENADITLLVLDASQNISEDDPILLHYKKNNILLLNKSDKLSASTPPSFIANKQSLSISAKTGGGLETLVAQLTYYISECYGNEEAPIITRARHRSALSAALTYLEAANANTVLELRCEELRRATSEIAKITGHISVDDVLDIVFSSFCIGK